MEVIKPVAETFLYFAYGGNMLTLKMHLDCPSAKFLTIARIDNYRLEFIRYSNFWGGPSTTLVPTANAHAWGVVWKVLKQEANALDEQKSVEENMYYVKYKDVQTPHLGTLHCKTYIQKTNPLPRGDSDDIPVERWPSWMHKEIMILGALEHELPEYYIDNLIKLKDNGEKGCFKMVCLLRRYAMETPCACRVPGRIPRKPLKWDKASSGQTQKRIRYKTN